MNLPLLANNSIDAGDWWQQAVASPLAIRLLIIAAITVFFLVLGGRIVRRMPRLPKRERFSSESGTATLEFTLVFPILIFLTLTLVQVTTLYAGNLVVHYAGFAATRAAIVQIPADHSASGEPINVIYHGEGGAKFDHIRQAAIIAVMPVAGPGEGSDADASGVAQGIAEHYTQMRGSQPAWIETLIPERVHYAADSKNTQITLLRTRIINFDSEVEYEPIRDGEYATYGPREPVTVLLTHRLNLGVPYVRMMFADGTHDVAGGGNGAYTEVSAQYTLTNEGLVDALPPKPTIDRIP